MSKIPLRGISKFFTNLDAGVRARLESAFAEAEDLMDVHNNSNIQELEKRKLSGLVAAPQITLKSNPSGFEVTWPRLTDRKISFYEVQIGADSGFSDPTTYQVLDNSVSIDGVSGVLFARVRGVRFDGKVGEWSETQDIDVNITNAPLIYTRGLSDVSAFYLTNAGSAFPDPIQHLTVTPQRINGGVVVFGSFGVEFYIIGSSFSFLDGDDNLKVRLNGRMITSPLGNPWNDPVVGGQITSGAVISWSSAYGPGFLTHDLFYVGQYDYYFGRTAANNGTGSGDGVHTSWTNIPAASGPIKLDLEYDYTDGAYYEVSGLGVGDLAITSRLRLTKFGFKIPSTDTIVGIEVRIRGDIEVLGTVQPATNPLIQDIALVQAGVASSGTNGNLDPWPVITDSSVLPTEVSYGGPLDLWGEAPGFWTPAKINSNTFGMQIRGRLRGPTGAGIRDDIVSLLEANLIVYTIKANTDLKIEVIYDSIYDPTTPDINMTVVKNCSLNVIEFGEVPG